MEENNILNNHYEKYVGCYAKRFYSPFELGRIYEIVGFELKGEAFFKMEGRTEVFEWDVDDCVIITNEMPIIEDERVANTNHKDYNGYNPFI